jgi:NADH-quinone oxidoreductase subunit J
VGERGVSPIVFLVLAALTVLSALMVVLHPSPVYSALGLVGTLGLIAVLFLGLDAHVVGFLQIIVYAGAIVVLFLFVIMLLNLQEDPHALSAPVLVAVGTTGGVVLAGALAAGVARAPVPTPEVPEGFGGAMPLAERLFTAYLLPFELTSILLLVAIVGAVVLGKRTLS